MISDFSLSKLIQRPHKFCIGHFGGTQKATLTYDTLHYNMSEILYQIWKSCRGHLQTDFSMLNITIMLRKEGGGGV